MKFRTLAGIGAAALFVLAPSYDALAKQRTQVKHRAQVVEHRINVVERATTDAVLDLGAKGDSAGDILTFANKVYDEANKKEIGSDTGWCIRVLPGASWECFWTLRLAGGQITVEGPFLDKGDSVFAVTGGTGKYVRARGEMALHARDEKGSEYDFKYTIK